MEIIIKQIMDMPKDSYVLMCGVKSPIIMVIYRMPFTGTAAIIFLFPKIRKSSFAEKWFVYENKDYRIFSEK